MANTEALELARRERLEKSKLVLADRLKTLQAADFVTFEDIVRHVKEYLAHGLTMLAKLVGFDQIAGDLFDEMQGKTDKATVLDIWKNALLDEETFFAGLVQNIPGDRLPHLFKFWLVQTKERATWEQLVNAFPYSALRDCAREGDKRADEAADAPEAEVVEEVVDVEPTDAEPPADTGKPSADGS